MSHAHPSAAAACHKPRPPAAPADGVGSRAHSGWQRGLALLSSGQPTAARECFAQATRLAPQDALYWINWARCEQQLGRHNQAVTTAQRALALERSSWFACTLLAQMERDAHRWMEMLAVLEQFDPAVERDPAWHQLHGGAQLAERRVDAAALSFLSALTLADSDLAMRQNALGQPGHRFVLLRRHRDAGQYYRMVLDINPLALGNAIYAATYSSWACDWTMLEQDIASLDSCMAATRAQPGGAATEQVSPFCPIGLSDDPHLLKWLVEQACARNTAAPPERVPRPTGEVSRRVGRLRIGWVSSDFHQHATLRLLVEVLETFDRKHFELAFYSGCPDDRTAMRRRVPATAAQVHEVAHWSDDELAAPIRRDEISVLIDLEGFTAHRRFYALARRPAPIQIAWLGYPGTSGAGFIDCIVGDSVVTTMAAQAELSEHIAQMPRGYQPNDSTRFRSATAAGSDCVLPAECILLASFNQSYKILPPRFEAWCSSLAATPRSVPWLLVPQHDIQARLREAAAGYGNTPGHLIFPPFVDIEPHRAGLPNADLFLDTYPCGGHTTTGDALWAGVPVLTMIEVSYSSCVAASLATTLGLPDLVCADLDAYITLALRLVGDPHVPGSLRQRPANSTRQSPRFDGRRFARDFEQLLLPGVERQDTGLPPAPPEARVTPTTWPSTQDNP